MTPPTTHRTPRDDGTAELRGAIREAFPQLTESEISFLITLMRAENERRGGA